MIPGTEVPVLGHGQISLGAGVIVLTGAWPNNTNIVKILLFLILTISLKFFSVPGIDQTIGIFTNDDQVSVYQNCKLHDHRHSYCASYELAKYFTVNNVSFL